jgi:outer membrane protein TolC
VPILGQKSGKIVLAKAELEQAARQYEAVRQKIGFQVREAYTQCVWTGEEFVLWRNDIVRYCLMR